MQGYCDVFFLRIILRRTSIEALVYVRRHQGAKVKHFDVSNVIYHKFSHGAAFYTLNGKNVNVMLEFSIEIGKKNNKDNIETKQNKASEK